MSDEPGDGLVERLPARLDALRGRIAAAGGGPQVEVLAVTKGFGAEAVRAAVAAGLVAVGENYAQELVAKAAELSRESIRGAQAEFHFIGQLQRNKVRALAEIVAVWQTVDRPQLAAEIARRAPGATVLVQLDLSGQPGRGGCDPNQAGDLVRTCRELGLQVTGLMGVAPAGPAEIARPGFRELVAQADRLDLAVRSIGMSGDLEVAVQEGSTQVRIGRDLFGPRPLSAPEPPPDGSDHAVGGRG